MSDKQSSNDAAVVACPTELDDCLEAFQAVLNRGLRPSLENYLPDGPAAAMALVELVHVELEFRLKRGEAARVEEYLARHPHLAENASVVVELVMAEYAFRRRWEHGLQGEAFLQRFPAHRDALAARFVDGERCHIELDRTIPFPVPVESNDEESFPRLPGYEIVSELGRGAMGVVYKARHLALNRLVALKMLHASRQGDAEQRLRFRKEVEIIALLQHANIVQVHDVGEHGGRPFFTMEYLDGGSLADHYGGAARPPREAAEVVETLARAMHAVHAKGIVHRDLKPSNVLRTAEGCLKIADFGLAHQESSDLTATGDLLGTPSYMAPEQAAGKVRAVGPAADVYALGALLYQLLTGRLPFRGVTALEVIRQVQDSDPLSPRRLEPHIPRDVETICLKCLRKEPNQRYVSAGELADDLRRYLNGESIRARPPAWPERGVRWLRRRPAVAVAVAAVVLVAVAVPLALLGHTLHLQEALDREQMANEKARQAEELARSKAEEVRAALYAADVKLAHDVFKTGNVFEVSRLLNPHRGENSFTDDPRGFEWGYLQHQGQTARPALAAHDGSLHLLAYSPDGRSLISGGGNPDRPTLQVWDRQTGQSRFRQALHSFFPTHECTPSAYAERGGLLAGRNEEGVVTLWNFASGQPRFRLKHSYEVLHIAVAPDSRWLAVNDGRGTILWNCATGQTHKILPIKGDPRLAFSPDGGTLLAAHSSESFLGLQWWDVAAGVLREQRMLPDGVLHAAYSPRGTFLLLIEGNGQGAIWSAEQRVALYWSHTLGAVRSLAVSADERTLAAGDADGRVRLWDIPSGRLRGQYRWQPNAIVQLAFAADNRTLAAATAEGQIHQLDATVCHVPDRLQTCAMLDLLPVWSPDGETIAAAASGGTVHLFDRRTAQTRSILRCPFQNVHRLAFSPNGRTLAVVCEQENFVRLWDVSTGQPRAVTSSQSSPIGLIAFCPDGRLASVDSRTICFWDADKGTACGSMEIDRTIQALAFLPDGWPLLATDSTIEVLERRTAGVGRPVRPLTSQLTPAVRHLAVSRDGRRAASGAADGTVRLWRISLEGKLIAEETKSPWRVGRGPVTSLQFRGDGKSLLFFGPQKGYLHELPDGRCQDNLFGVFHCGIFSPDGQTLATTGGDGIVRLWDVEAWRIRQPSGLALNRVTSLLFSIDGRTLITAARGSGFRIQSRKLWVSETAPLMNTAESLRCWDAATGRETPADAPNQETMTPPHLVAQSPDGRLLAAGGGDGCIHIWDRTRKQEPTRLFVSDKARLYAESMQLARRLWKNSNPDFGKRTEGVAALAFSPDGRWLATAGNRGSFRVWQTDGWKECCHWQDDVSGSPWLTFAPDSSAVAGSRGGQVCIWNAQTGERQAALGSETASTVLCGVFVPGKDVLAFGSQDGLIRLWNWRGGAVKTLPVGHPNRVASLAFAPDGKTLASGGWDHTVRLWHLKTGREVATLESHHGRVNAVAFSPDGQTLASGGEIDGDRGEVLLWHR